MAAENRKDVACVVAIDIGTTFSGYALSSVKDFKKDRLTAIRTNQPWNSGVTQLSSFKTPTSLLLTKTGEFKCFGFSAESEYNDLLLDDNTDSDDFFYFRQFKMILYSQRPSLEMKVKDVKGREYSALQVFQLSIKALKDHCIEFLAGQKVTYDPDEIKWCLTVPAIWSEEAKMFMRKAGEKAGIPSYRLVVAREPEVAALYCQAWYTEKEKKSIFYPGTKYLIVDLGGGTADVCGHEILENDLIKEICPAKGCDSGGTSVDREFSNILLNILGRENMDKFMKTHTQQYLDLMASFECAKRNITNEQKMQVNICIPLTCLNNLVTGKTFNDLTKASEYKNKITVYEEKMRLDPDFSKSLFANTSEKILSTIGGILQNDLKGNTIDIILLVGGLSANKIVQENLTKAYPDKQIIVPDDPTLAVLKGAVLFGHQPDIITTRIAQYSYGRKIIPLFDKKRHDSRRKVHIDGKPRCDGVFELLVKAGKPVPIGTKIRKEYHTVSKTQDKIRISLYKGANDETRYVDEAGCSLVGECLVPVPAPSEPRRHLSVEFQFGDTEICITAVNMNTKNESKYRFQLE